MSQTLENTFEYMARVVRQLGLLHVYTFTVPGLRTVSKILSQARDARKKSEHELLVARAIEKLESGDTNTASSDITALPPTPSTLVRITDVCLSAQDNRTDKEKYVVIDRAFIDSVLLFLNERPIELVNVIYWYDAHSHSLLACSLPSEFNPVTQELKPLNNYGRFSGLFVEKYFPRDHSVMRYAHRLFVHRENTDNKINDCVYESEPYILQMYRELVLVKSLWKLKAQDRFIQNQYPSDRLAQLRKRNVLVVPVTSSIEKFTSSMAAVVLNTVNTHIDEIYYLVDDIQQFNISDAFRVLRSFYHYSINEHLKFRFVIDSLKTLGDVRKYIATEHFNLIVAPLHVWFDDTLRRIHDNDATPYAYALSVMQYNPVDGKGRLSEHATPQVFMIPDFDRWVIKCSDMALREVSVNDLENTGGFVVRNPARSIHCFSNSEDVIVSKSETMQHNLPAISISQM